MRQTISKKNIYINLAVLAAFVSVLFIVRSFYVDGAVGQGDNVIIDHSPVPFEFKLLETSDLDNIYVYDETRMNLYVYDHVGVELYVYDLPSVSTINVVNISEESETITFYHHRLNTYLVMDFQGNIFLTQEYPADHIPDEIDYTDNNDGVEINNNLLFYTIEFDDSTSFSRISFTTFIIMGVIAIGGVIGYIKLKNKRS
jgi:hypothetical protein